MHRTRWMSATAALAVPALVLATAQGASAASATVASWGMNDTGTTMSDSSGHGHNGTLHTVKTAQPGFAGSSFGFFGHPSYVSVPSAADLNPGTANFSFTLHVKFPNRPSSSVGDYDLMRKGLATTDGGSWKVEVLGSGKAFCDFRGATHEGTVTSTNALSAGAWHTITCTRTATTVQIVADGATVTKTVTTGSISNSGSVFLGAKNGTGADQLTGYLDSVTVRKG
ncbi:LamG domain-containing protein [Amnibacterium sp. CER49]|uniref:LamG-like jellyroll fold domain-containing protein n=1 Tax=Amnibacterium sp. CER49 TaxID=3039161 RepID=UPI002447F4A9|nr:LamG-like jellyroll fold domain-containing protein [Amnibacterium sp. CER49]MDH2443037.1 LamG domain-containing protein [Amnibacterium sp. CER49]